MPVGKILQTMLAIPEIFLARFNEVLKQRAVHESSHIYYRKWLRYFLDFCRKYPHPETKSEQVRLFIEKLKSKKQKYHMDTLTFISKILETLAWPIAVVVIVILLKDKIGLALTEYQNLKLKYKDFEINFNKKLESVERGVEKVSEEENITLETIESPKLIKLAKYSPRAAILESWIEFEELLYKLLEEVGYSKERPGGVHGKIIRRPLNEVEDILTEKGILNRRLNMLISEIKSVRNEAVHSSDRDFTFHSVERFIQSVNETKYLIENLANKALQGTRVIARP